MRQKQLQQPISLLAFSVLFLLCAAVVFAPKAGAFTGAGGDGTSGNPYLIDACSQLGEIDTAPDAYYELTDDLFCHDLVAGAGTIPIAMDSGGFGGSFDGQGHSISGIVINMPSTNSVGLFYEPSGSAIIKNLSVYGDITGASNTGMIAGILGGGAQIIQVDTHGSVTCSNNCGGIAGQMAANSSLTRSWSDVEVGGVGYVYGGIAGWANGDGGPVTISEVYHRGDVIGEGADPNYVGGIVGFALTLTLTNAYSTGSISGKHYVGGIVGVAVESAITHTFTAATVQGIGTGVLFGGMILSSTPNPNYYDAEATGFSGDDGYGSVEITEADYFIQNSTSAVFVNWNFDDVWRVQYKDYPVLAPIREPYMLCEAPQSTDTTMTGRCDYAPAGWGIPTWEARWQKQGDSTWTTLTLSDIHLAQASVTGLTPSTWYNLQFRYTNNFETSQWGTQHILTTVAVSTPSAPVATSTVKTTTTVSSDSENDSTESSSFIGELVAGEVLNSIPKNTGKLAYSQGGLAEITSPSGELSPYVRWGIGGLFVLFGLLMLYYRTSKTTD